MSNNAEITRSIATRSTQLSFTIKEEMSLTSVADVFVKSGLFADSKSQAVAIVKILAGREMNLEPVQSMMDLFIINGRIGMYAEAMASKIKASKKYRYKVLVHTETECSIQFFERVDEAWEQCGPPSTFSAAEARRASTKNMDKFPKNMLFSRALSNGFRWYCPDLKISGIYTPEELEDEFPVGYRPVEQSGGARSLNDTLTKPREIGPNTAPAASKPVQNPESADDTGEDTAPAAPSNGGTSGENAVPSLSYPEWLNFAEHYKNTLGEDVYREILATFHADKANKVPPHMVEDVMRAFQEAAEEVASPEAPAPSAAALAEVGDSRKPDLVAAITSMERNIGTDHRPAYDVNVEDHSKSTSAILRTYLARLLDISNESAAPSGPTQQGSFI